jgi:VWA domain-containing protein
MIGAQIVWLTPTAALVGIAALVPLTAWMLGERRVRRARETLHLHPSRRGTWWAPAAIAAALALVAVAAAQPTIASTGGRSSERTGQVFVVVDTSTSMRAGRPTRYARATAAALRIRDDLIATPVGLASVTDRVLPHIFPTIDRDDYLATLRQAMGVDRPPPSKARRQASSFAALAEIGSARFFMDTVGQRVAVLLTDGESRPFDPGTVARALERAHVRLVIVRFWNAAERIAGDPVYRADTSSAVQAQALATQMHSGTYDEEHVGDAVRAVRRALGNQHQKLPPRAASTSRPLAPFAMLAALVPLSLLVWRRNIH